MLTLKQIIKPLLFFFFLLFAASACAIKGGDPGQTDFTNDLVPPEVRIIADTVSKNLRDRGLEVREGYLRAFTIADCDYVIGKTGVCFGNNPAAPYIIPVIPAWDNERLCPQRVTVFPDTPVGYGAIRQFDLREATVVIGRMPSPARYFGFQTYQYSRKGELNKKTDVYDYINTNFPYLVGQFYKDDVCPGRIISFASISNSNNNVVSEEREKPFWSQFRSFIITPDQTMDSIVRASLNQAGIQDAKILTEHIPSSVTVGLLDDADDFISLIRYAMPENVEKADDWRAVPQCVVLRVRDRNTHRSPKPYPAFSPEKRTAENENYLSRDLNALNNNVRAKWNLGPAPDPPDVSDRMIDIQRVSTMDLVGPDCIANTINCQGDSQDTTYMGRYDMPLETEDKDFIYAVVGTIGVETKNATYTSLGVYSSESNKGLACISDTQLKDSQQFLPKEPIRFDHADKFFIWYFCRDCSKVKTNNCSEIDTADVPLMKTLKLTMRNYIHPGTARGPNSDPPFKPEGISPLLTPWVITIPMDNKQ